MINGPKQVGTLDGVPVIVSPDAMTKEPRFPDKRNTKRRRRRVIGKYGSWFVLRPTCIKTQHGLVMHPLIHDQMRREMRAQSNAV